jgi:hypothetical protein
LEKDQVKLALLLLRVRLEDPAEAGQANFIHLSLQLHVHSRQARERKQGSRKRDHGLVRGQQLLEREHVFHEIRNGSAKEFDPKHQIEI